MGRAGAGWVVGALVAVAMALLAAPVGAQAAPGDLDPSFGTGGKVLTDLGEGENVRDAVLQSDGKVVVLGISDDGTATPGSVDFLLLRYLPDGSLDTTFSGGIAEAPAGVSLTAVAIQTDGKIVAAGRDAGGFAVVRYHPNGSLDTTFDGDGIAPSGNGAWATSLVIQPDGKIVVGGSIGLGDPLVTIDTRPALARFNPNGSLDPTFSGDGLEVTDVGGIYNSQTLRLAPGGKLVMLSSNVDSEIAPLIRYNPDGSLDSSFSGDGKLVDLDVQASDFAVLPDGKLLLVHVGGPNLNANGDTAHFTRYLPDGSPDTSFSEDGRHTTTVDGPVVSQSVVVQPDGKIIVGGSHGNSTFISIWPRFDSTVLRFNPTGILDPSFAGDGQAILDVGGFLDGFYRVLLQADGKIVGVGSRFLDDTSGNDSDITLARLQGGGPPPHVTAPETTITSGPGGVTTDVTPTFAFGSSEPGSSFACRVDGAAFAPCASPHTTAALATGAHTFYVRATDPTGNTDPTPASYPFSVSTPPATPSGPMSPKMPGVSRVCTNARTAKTRAKRHLSKAQKQLRRAKRPAAKRGLRRVVKKRKTALRRMNRQVKQACRS